MPHLSDYPHLVDTSGQFTIPPAAFLLAFTQAPPSVTENLSPAQRTEIDASTVLSGQAARTCYSGSGIVTSLDYVLGTEKHRATTDKVAASTLGSGHLTTRQHRTLSFGLYLSRYLAWVLHSQPFYNSEQVSERYVAMDETSLMVPGGDVFTSSGQELVLAYQRLKDILTPVARQLLRQRFPGRSISKWQTWLDSEAEKKAQEVARYILPWGFQTYMYFTITDLTLMRLHRLSLTYDIGAEATTLIRLMVELITSVDPSFADQITDPLPLESTPEYQLFASRLPDSALFGQKFDLRLHGHPVLVRPDPTNPFFQLADAIQDTLGFSREQLGDAEAVDMVLNPNRNPILSSTLGESVMHQLTQSLNQVVIRTLVRLSFAADSQFQRHRGFFHTRPVYSSIPDPDRDIITPALIAYSQEARSVYREAIQTNNRFMQSLLEQGVPQHQINYLQVKGAVIRKRAALPLGYLYPFLKARTCLNAQEEIYAIAVSIIQQLQVIDPKLAAYFSHPSPCGVRKLAGIGPHCPEGARYCGDPRMWSLPVDDYPDRLI